MIEQIYFKIKQKIREWRLIKNSPELKALIQSVIDSSPEQVEQYFGVDKDQRHRYLGYFVGQTMKESKGKANPLTVNLLLKKMLK